MDLNKIAIDARIRTAWEAIDLGFVMARAWWLPLFLSWFIPALVVYIVASLIFRDSIWWTYFIVWLFKPLFDRGPLLLSSRLLFGESVALKQFFREIFSLYKFDSLLWITFRRLSPTRSFDMPLTVLERAKGAQREKRQGVLHRTYSNAATWLTFVCVHVEAIISAGIFFFIVQLIPSEANVNFIELILEQPLWLQWASNSVGLIAMAIVGPFYAVAGFALYISRRIELEAWDIEIRFRQLAADYDRKANFKTESAKILSIALAAALSLLLLASPAPVVADVDKPETENNHRITYEELQTLYSKPTENNDNTVTESIKNNYAPDSTLELEAKHRILDTLAGDDFHQIEEVTRFRLKNQEETDPEEIPGWLPEIVRFFEDNEGFFSAIAKIIAFPFKFIEFILWGGAIALVLFVLYKYREAIAQFVRKDSIDEEEAAPEVMFGLDVTRESLPDDIPGQVQNLWQDGEYRASIALLYRAMLSELIHDYQFQFRDSYTEGEVLHLIRKQATPDLTEYSSTLTGIWQRIAYGHITPSADTVKDLCRRWPLVFNAEARSHE